MFAREYRPLKRPRLGVPDFYPQDDKQKEDELNSQTLAHGYRHAKLVDPQHEFGSALKDFSQHLLNPKEYSLRVNQVMEEKKKRRWVQDSERRKFQVTKDNFFPVPLGRNRKEIAGQWFQELAGSKPLSVLAKKVPVFNKKEEIFDNLCEKDVPISRAAWYIKMTAAYSTTITDLKLNKKKQTTDPSFDWTVSLTKYMQECVWRICNDTLSHQDSGRHASSGGQGHTPSEEGLAELTRWQYMVYLSSWMYQENLLDNHEFLRWLVERVEHIKSSDTKAIQLYLPLVLKHLLDIGSCVALAKPLVKYCCQRLAAFLELEQKLAKFQTNPTTPTLSSLKPLPEHGEASLEDDSVFDSIKHEPINIKTEPGTSKSRKTSSSRDRKHTATTPSALGGGDGEIPIITMKMEDGVKEGAAGANSGYFHWCAHHQSLMLQLCCVIQTIAIRCPTAFVHTKIFIGRGVSVRDGAKATMPLSLLPMGLTELPMPQTLGAELQRKLLPALASAEQEIILRNKAAESSWSAVTVADLQTTSEGTNVQQVLKLLEVLDTHSFLTSRSYNPLTTLYSRISAIQKSSEHPLGNDMFVMLLCQWAVSSHRSGVHRPLVVARILRQRQDQIIRGADWKDELDKAAMDETWEEFGDSCYSTAFPLQSCLVRFLDQRAPLPEDLAFPVKTTDPFYHLLMLFSELIHLKVFSFTNYMSTLISRGEVKTPIIPYLPFARDDNEGVEPSRKRQAQDTETLNCSIPLPALKRPHLDAGEPSMDRGSQSSLTGIASGPPSPGGTFGTGMGNFMDLFGGGSDSGSSMFPPDVSEMDESKALFQKRAQQLQMLTSATSRLVSPSPLDFSPSHTDTDAPSTPAIQTKDPFNFSILFPDEDQNVDPTLDKHASRHLIFASYFPVSGLGQGFSRQDHNERAVVLCGVGKTRLRVETTVKGIAKDVEHYFRLLTGIQSPILPDILKGVMGRFRSLPSFEQCTIATSCEEVLRAGLKRKTPYPVCAQLVFVCELLEICGCIRQLLDLLVDVVACERSNEDAPSSGRKGQQPPLPPLPEELALPVLWLLQKYLSCLLLSQEDTAVVFENLARVLETVQPMEISSTQKATFLFLHRLYTNCAYLQSTFRSSFGHMCMQLGEVIIVDSYSPTSTDVEWQKIFLGQVSKPSDCNIPKLCATIKGAHIPKTNFCFAVDVFYTACQKNVTCQTLCDLAKVCAAVSCSCGPKINKELMGALRALCIPAQILKSCSTGYTALTARTNILQDPGIHSNLITFIALLLANNCLHLHDIITYIIRPIIRTQIFPAIDMSPNSGLAVEFINSLILHLFVRDYEVVADARPDSPIVLPQFVQHCLEAKCRDLNLGFVLMLLKDLVKIRSSASSKTDSLLVHSNSSGNEVGINKLKSTLEVVACQQWVRNQCSQQPSRRLLDTDMLGEKYLMPSQARYLFLLLCPYSNGGDPSRLSKNDPNSALEHILKNLDQWTLNNSLLHIEVIISQMSTRSSLLDELAAQVIHVFEDSCGDEWLGQTIECAVDGGDGSFSPSVWLVTPLISKLQEGVLGRVLKSAGNVLGQGQWWNPEKNQEKRRATRATSGVTTPKTGLQWQQPFLELVLACMHAQSTTHEELLGPLKTQLSTFLAAFEKEGMPSDEQGKAMLYAALKLRLSLVGSMLGSICVSEGTTLEWLHLLMQFICSGSIDRQTDSSELFTNCLDMICTLLHSLSSEFHISLANWGEEGKKSHTTCIKKLKTELANSKSYCSAEIRQLFPLSQKSYTVTTVKPPASIMFNKGVSYTDRIKGLRINDTKDICPWEILEGVKNSGPLMLSWFGAVRMKRKPLWFEEQRHLVRFHAHQNQFQNLVSGPHTVLLPEEQLSMPAPVDGEKPTETSSSEAPKQTTTTGTASGEAMDVGNTTTMPNPVPATGHAQNRAQMQYPGGAMPGQDQQRMMNPMNPHMQQAAAAGMPRTAMNTAMRIKLQEIYEREQSRVQQQPHTHMNVPPPVYPGGAPSIAPRPARVPGMAMPGYSGAQMNHQQKQIQMLRMHQQRRMQMLRMQQMQQQQMMQQQQQQQQYGYQGHTVAPGMHAGMRPMHANPPVPMQHVMQQRYPMGPGPMMAPPSGVPPGRQPGMQYPPGPPQMAGMNIPRQGPGMY